MLLYFIALMFLFCFALASPVIYEFFRIGSAPGAGAKEQEQLTQAMREALDVYMRSEGIVNDEAYRIADDAGLEVIMGVCIRHTRERLEGTTT